MSDVAIYIENLGKRYWVGSPKEPYGTLRDSLVSVAQAPLRALQKRNRRSSRQEFWALRDVSFEVKHGEVLGIIGRNGAGKSTLLKILSRITEPTTGSARIHGRVGSLLEVGTGFHPELTGRENIYLNGAILGMKKSEIDHKFEEIVEFAEIEHFLETPVKRYSSGMYMRLGFSIAAHLEPEILIVDEVLAVGDATFQNKCLGKMGDVAKQGRTVIFVSHSMASIVTLCQSAILLDAGRIRSIDTAEKVAEEYLTSITHTSERADLRRTHNRRGTGEVRIVEAAVLDHTGKPCSSFRYGEDLCFEFTLEAISSSPNLICVVWIKTSTGIPVLHLASHDDLNWRPIRVSGKASVHCVLNNCKLYPGTYLVSLWVGPSHRHDTDFVIDELQFRMEQGELLHRGFDMNWTLGIFHSESRWSISAIEDNRNAKLVGDKTE